MKERLYQIIVDKPTRGIAAAFLPFRSFFPAMDGRIFHIKELLAANLNRDWTIEEMAGLVELSVPHFQKLFKTNTGTSPMAYLRDLRLARACERLESSFHQLKQIRIDIGMTDNSHFTRDFKVKFGLTPSEYRRQHWEKIQNNSPIGAKS